MFRRIDTDSPVAPSRPREPTVDDCTPLRVLEARRRGRGLQYLCEVAGAAPAWLPGRVVNRYPELLAEFAELNEEVD